MTGTFALPRTRTRMHSSTSLAISLVSMSILRSMSLFLSVHWLRRLTVQWCSNKRWTGLHKALALHSRAVATSRAKGNGRQHRIASKMPRALSIRMMAAMMPVAKSLCTLWPSGQVQYLSVRPSVVKDHHSVGSLLQASKRVHMERAMQGSEHWEAAFVVKWAPPAVGKQGT